MKIVESVLSRFRPYNKIRVPSILQSSDTECGVAALAMLFSFYNAKISIEQLREDCGAARDGCKVSTLISVSKKYGFTATAYKTDIDEIRKLDEPVIAFWNFSHYVVIKGFGKNRIFINDPAQGAMRVSFTEFDCAFTGIIIAIEPTNVISIPSNKINKKNELISLIQSNFTTIFFIIICLLVSLIATLIPSAQVNLFIEQCLMLNNRAWLPMMGLLSLGIYSILIGSQLSLRWHQFKLATTEGIKKSSFIIAHMLQLPLIFYSLRQKSELIAIISRMEQVISVLLNSIYTISGCILSISITFFILVKINSHLAMVSAALLLFSIMTIYLIAYLNLDFEKLYLNLSGKFYAYSMSAIRNLETIKSSGLEDAVLLKLYSYWGKKTAANDKVNNVNILSTTVMQFLSLFSTLLILWLGALNVASGLISIGSLISYYTIHQIFYNSIFLISTTLTDGFNAYVAHLRICDLTSYDKDYRFSHVHQKIAQTENCFINCKDITFFYNKTGLPILSNINLQIKRGEHLALVGGTGSGKSTLAKLLCGLYPSHYGTISIFGQNIETFSTNDFENYFSYVSQDISLFSGTLHENLTMWRDLNYEKLCHVIEICCLTDLVLKRGLYASVNEHGANFSGGEKQRIEIARALLQDTPILILDEATSALDTETEAILISNLRKTNKTIIFVAHRLTTIQHCDQIVLLDNGKILEHGTHHELLKNQHNYYSLNNAS